MLLRIAVVLAIVATGAFARAGDDDAAARARGVAREAQELASAGSYLAAAERYKAALALDPLPEYQCNVGVAYWKARDLPRAQLFLGLCTARDSHLPPEFVASVQGVLAEIEAQLRDSDFAPVDVIVTPETTAITVSSFAPDDAFVGSRIVWLPFGEHELTATSPGHDPVVQKVVVERRDPMEVRIVLPETPPPPPEIIREPAPPVAELPASARPRLTVPLIAAGVTLVAAVTDVVLWRSADASAERAGMLPAGPEYDNAAALARSRRGQLYAMYAVTTGCAAATAYLFWRARPRARRQLAVSAEPGGAAVWLSGAF